MIELNIVQVYLEQNIMNIPTDHADLFPNDGFICPVVCDGLRFVGAVSRDAAPGDGVRLYFNLRGDDTGDNRCYQAYMRGKGVGARLTFTFVLNENNAVSELVLINTI
jgi:hypothetical protein